MFVRTLDSLQEYRLTLYEIYSKYKCWISSEGLTSFFILCSNFMTDRITWTSYELNLKICTLFLHVSVLIQIDKIKLPSIRRKTTTNILVFPFSIRFISQNEHYVHVKMRERHPFWINYENIEYKCTCMYVQNNELHSNHLHQVRE